MLSGKFVACFMGFEEEEADILSAVWVNKMNGAIGVVERSPLSRYELFFGCDAIVSSGGAYQDTARWAFRSDIPVINLWNVDGYYLQASLLNAYHQIESRSGTEISVDSIARFNRERKESAAL